MFPRILIIFLFLSVQLELLGQAVTVSSEFSIRNDHAYDVIGQLKENILLYRDRGNEKVVEVFDQNLRLLFDRELHLGEKKTSIYGLTRQSDSFITFSGFRKKKKYSLLAHRFDENASPMDTVYLIDEEEDFKLREFIHIESQDKSKSLLFSSKGDDLLYMYVIDNDSIELLWWKEILVKDFNPGTDFLHGFITNNGEANILLYDIGKQSKKDEAQFMLIGSSDNADVYVNKFIVNKKYIVDIECRFDEMNQSYIMAGLASDDQENDADCYFFSSKNINALSESNLVPHRDFDNAFIDEVYGEKLGKKKRLKDFVTRDVIVRADGGIVLVTEMEKEFYRRSSFNSVARNSDNYGRGWVDTYTEDIILVSLAKSGTEEWKKILYKKQFSQDDEGVYSSFFIFKNPSRLRLIYNDEIKNNITVSEYVLDPLGRHERNSLLSTEYQNLKIRWKDGVQIAPSVMIAPSENNYKLSLVKVDYNYKS